MIAAQPAQPERTSLANHILTGDAWTVAKSLPSEITQCIITSPPYFGHRQYAVEVGEQSCELGREPDAELYIGRLLSLFDELKRLLVPSGTLWLNLGDTYRKGQLLGIPWRAALGLQSRGWFLRSEIIWNKPNAMPSPVSTRPTTSHEHLFLLTKSPTYFYDADAIREPHVTFGPDSKMKGGRRHLGKRNGTPENGKNKGNSNLHKGRWDQAFHPQGRNKRTVWNIPLGKFRDAHFAVFPEQLVEYCVLAGTREGDLVLDPFMGSGTTAVVAQRFRRLFLGIELIPRYAQMARNRVSHPTLFA